METGSMDPLPMFSHILSMKTYYTAMFMLLAYDYCLTFSAEVELAWKSRKTLASVLFLLNRYLSLVFSIIILISYYSPFWTFLICDQYAITEFVYTVLIFTIAEIFLMLRVHILTHKNMKVTCLLLVHIIAQLVLGFFTLSKGGKAAPQIPPPQPPIDPYLFQICVLFPTPASAKLVTDLDLAYLGLALSYDIVVFVTTLTMTIVAARTSPTRRWLWVIQRDGILYFTVIFSVKAIWLVFSLGLPDYLKLMNAIPAITFTAIMINRLYLSLKKVGQEVDRAQSLYVPKRLTRQDNNEVELQVMVSQHIVTLSDR